jgi:hypothetical protein
MGEGEGGLEGRRVVTGLRAGDTEWHRNGAMRERLSMQHAK